MKKVTHKKFLLSKETLGKLDLSAVGGGEREGGGGQVISHDPVCFYTTHTP